MTLRLEEAVFEDSLHLSNTKQTDTQTDRQTQRSNSNEHNKRNLKTYLRRTSQQEHFDFIHLKDLIMLAVVED